MPTQIGQCPKCYAANAYTAITCIECGQALPWAAVAATAQQQQTAPAIPSQNQPMAPPPLMVAQAYNAPQLGQVSTEQTSLAIASMVLGIIGLIFFWLWIIAVPCYLLAFILGIIALRQQQGGRGMAIAGLTMGSIGLVLCLISAMAIGMFFSLVGVGAKIRSEAVDQLKVTNTAARVTSTGSEFSKVNTILITGSTTNPSSSTQKFILDAQIFNGSNVMVANRTYYEMVQGGETKPFAIEVRDTTQSQPFTFKVITRAR